MGRSPLEWLCFFIAVVLMCQNPDDESIFLRRPTRIHCVVADTRPLVLSAIIGALVVVAFISWPQVSRMVRRRTGP
jgi:ABC-type dipeptide/oligopeptide/nickel transport system permease subunit